MKTGAFVGKCVMYCGLYLSEMLFSVRVVKPGAFHAWVSSAESALGAAA